MKKLLATLTVVLLSTCFAFAQEGSIPGVVTDATVHMNNVYDFNESTYGGSYPARTLLDYSSSDELLQEIYDEAYLSFTPQI